MARPAVSERGDFGVDAVIGDQFFQVKAGVSGLRSVREGFIPLAYWVGKESKSQGFLVLPDASITIERLREHWQHLASILRPDLRDRMTLCVGKGDHFIGIPRDPDIRTQRTIAKIVTTERSRVNSARPSRGDASFVVFKILLHHWLTDGGSVTTDWLAQTSGYSYPTVARPIAGMGNLIERQSDRKIRLRRFPRDEFARLVAVSDRVRGTVRFGDRSAQPRSPEAHARRLEKLNPTNLAIGGVLGATHYLPGLDLVGVPRLDLSQHAPGRRLDLAFIEKLDPALKRIDDPTEPASLVVHHVHHAQSLFTPRDGGLYWADPVECLLDLHEAHLEAQAIQFLKTLERRRPGAA